MGSALQLTLIRSSVGRKLIMAITGLVLVGFVLGHMAGNMLIYKGPAALNAYAAGLHAMPALLWLVRVVLLTATLLHIWAATSLTLTNLGARPGNYSARDYVVASYASRTMVWSGPVLALFVAYHLAHLTLGWVHAASFVSGDVYHNVVMGFRNPAISTLYVAALLALGLHLYHGAWSALQTVGASHPRYDGLRKVAAGLLAVAVTAGNASFPVAVLVGFVR